MYSSQMCASEKDHRVANTDWNPMDTIQCIYWDRNDGCCRFLAGGWDGILRMYGLNFNPTLLEQQDAHFLQDPILSCTMDRNYLAFTGHTDGSIKMVNFPTRQIALLGKLSAPIKDLYWVQQINSLLVVTLDVQVTFWQTSQIGSPVFTVNLSNKTVTSAFDYPYLMLGSVGEKMSIFRVDQPNSIGSPKYYQSALGQYCKLLSCDVIAATRSWLMGSVDGRGNYGTFIQNSSGIDCSNSIVCFKAQKKEEYVKNQYYQVNSCGFHPKKPEVIFVAGGDNSIIFFTAQKNGDKIKTLKFKAPVTAAKLSPNGSFMAYALGNDWCQGLHGLGKYQPRIYVHMIMEDDIVKK